LNNKWVSVLNLQYHFFFIIIAFGCFLESVKNLFIFICVCLGCSKMFFNFHISHVWSFDL